MDGVIYIFPLACKCLASQEKTLCLWVTADLENRKLSVYLLNQFIASSCHCISVKPKHVEVIGQFLSA